MKVRILQLDIEGTAAECEAAIRQAFELIGSHAASSIVVSAPASIVEGTSADAGPVVESPQKKRRLPGPRTDGLTPGAQSLLDLMTDVAAPMTFWQIAKRNVVPTGSMYMHLQRLEALGLITRRPDKSYVVTNSSESTTTKSDEPSIESP